jgi:hypothetical protein
VQIWQGEYHFFQFLKHFVTLAILAGVKIVEREFASWGNVNELSYVMYKNNYCILAVVPSIAWDFLLDEHINLTYQTYLTYI